MSNSLPLSQAISGVQGQGDGEPSLISDSGTGATSILSAGHDAATLFAGISTVSAPLSVRALVQLHFSHQRHCCRTIIFILLQRHWCSTYFCSGTMTGSAPHYSDKRCSTSFIWHRHRCSTTHIKIGPSSFPLILLYLPMLKNSGEIRMNRYN